MRSESMKIRKEDVLKALFVAQYENRLMNLDQIISELESIIEILKKFNNDSDENLLIKVSLVAFVLDLVGKSLKKLDNKQDTIRLFEKVEKEMAICMKFYQFYKIDIGSKESILNQLEWCEGTIKNIVERLK